MTTQFLFILFICSFITGITPIISSVPRKYYLISSGKTWNDARAYCQAKYDDLAIINSATNLLRLQNDAQGTLTNLNIYIGMYLTPYKFFWSSGNESLGSFTNWMTGYPSNAGGNRFCVLLTASGWSNVGCTTQRPFICYDGSRSGTERYIYYSTVKTWSDAQSFCRQNHTDLASARDATEHSAIVSKISGETWFGLFKEPWKWLDETEMLLPWQPGQPDNHNGDEYIGYMYNFRAVDSTSTLILPFLCHRVITEHKRLRLKIESNQDVNDPAVNAAILDLIKQKLKDHGIEQNITLKWRKQPDGVVFHKLNIQ